jgi:hypothetical protein
MDFKGTPFEHGLSAKTRCPKLKNGGSRRGIFSTFFVLEAPNPLYSRAPASPKLALNMGERKNQGFLIAPRC